MVNFLVRVYYEPKGAMYPTDPYHIAVVRVNSYRVLEGCRQLLGRKFGIVDDIEILAQCPNDGASPNILAAGINPLDHGHEE